MYIINIRILIRQFFFYFGYLSIERHIILDLNLIKKMKSCFPALLGFIILSYLPKQFEFANSRSFQETIFIDGGLLHVALPSTVDPSNLDTYFASYLLKFAMQFYPSLMMSYGLWGNANLTPSLKIDLHENQG